MEGWRENRKGSALSTSPDPTADGRRTMFSRQKNPRTHDARPRIFTRCKKRGNGGYTIFVRYKLIALLGSRNLVSNILFYFSKYIKIFKIFLKLSLIYFFISLTR